MSESWPARAWLANQICGRPLPQARPHSYYVGQTGKFPRINSDIPDTGFQLSRLLLDADNLHGIAATGGADAQQVVGGLIVQTLLGIRGTAAIIGAVIGAAGPIG